MLIIGYDLHTRYQQIAMMDTETGELVERRLEHKGGEAQAFYASLPQPARVGIEATTPALWFERLLTECGHDLWVGDAAEIRAQAVRQQKTDRRDAFHLLELLLEDRFPRIWVPSPEERDVRQLLVHRDKLVRTRTAVKNQLHALALSQGICRRSKLWSARGRRELEKLELAPWASRRRTELLKLLDQLQAPIEPLDEAVQKVAERHAQAVRLMSQWGVGPVQRFPNSRKVVSYLGLNPSEHSSGGRQRLGSISKQGNTMLRWLLVEAAQTAARWDPELRRAYQGLKFRRCSAVAKVAIARKLAVRWYWTLRRAADQEQPVRTPSSPGSAVVPQTGSAE